MSSHLIDEGQFGAPIILTPFNYRYGRQYGAEFSGNCAATAAPAHTLTGRFDIINLFDRKYQIRNGTGVGVGAPQSGPRHGLFFGLSKSL